MNSNHTENPQYKKHIISMLVNNKPGVLIRIALVFAKRGFNIDALVTHATPNPEFSMITTTVRGDEETLKLILKQLCKIIDVIRAEDRSEEEIVTQELALIKCALTEENKSELFLLIRSLRCEIVDISDSAVIISSIGDNMWLNSLEKVFDSYGIIEVLRTGTLLMIRGAQTTA